MRLFVCPLREIAHNPFRAGIDLRRQNMAYNYVTLRRGGGGVEGCVTERTSTSQSNVNKRYEERYVIAERPRRRQILTSKDDLRTDKAQYL